MSWSENSPKRKSLRLAEYDYSQPGFYFITLCTNFRMPFLGSLKNGEVQLTRNGQMVASYWKQLPEHFPNVRINECQIMPDHLHGIIELIETGALVDRIPLPKIIQGYKSITTHDYITWVKSMAPDFPKPQLWQRNYYEHIIRNQSRLNKIRQYIRANPQ